MALKIRNKKQLQKVADAMRLLHQDMVWMWILESGQVCGSDMEPTYTEGEWLVSGGTVLLCQSNIELKFNSIDTLTQLRTDT